MPAGGRTAEARQQLRASLLEHARRLVEREGPDALTMRALAAEAGCAVGLPYKVFSGRAELVAELVAVEFRRLSAAFEALVASAGTGTVGDALGRFAETLLGADAPVVRLAHEVAAEEVSAAVDAAFAETGLLAAFERAVADYLAAEKRAGRVAAEVDEHAFGFLITGAVHNLLVSGPAYPRPDRAELRRMLRAVAARLALR